MLSEKAITEHLDHIADAIPGFIGASLVDLESGMTLAARSDRPDFDLAAASAYNCEMVKHKLRTIEALDLQTDLEDMMMTLGTQIHIIRIVNPTTFVYVAADRASSNLAIMRTIVSRHAGNFAL